MGFQVLSYIGMIHLLWIYLKPGLEQLFMKFSAFINLPVFIFLMAVSSLPATAEETPEVTVDGLYHIKDTNLAIVYIQPDADLGQYRLMPMSLSKKTGNLTKTDPWCIESMLTTWQK